MRKEESERKQILIAEKIEQSKYVEESRKQKIIEKQMQVKQRQIEMEKEKDLELKIKKEQLEEKQHMRESTREKQI